MGVICQIHLQRPRGDGIYRPGSTVVGTIKYAFSDDTLCQDIIIAFKGQGRCEWSEGSDKNRRRYVGNEKIFHFVSSILLKDSEEGAIIRKGAYDAPFQFIVPNNIPPSYHDINCQIKYYVSIKFIKPGTFASAKKFKTFIPVSSNIVQTLPDGQIIYGLNKTLHKMFMKTDEIVKLKAQLSKSFLKPQEKVELICNIENDSSVNITKVTTNLLQVNTYRANGGRITRRYRKFPECKSTLEEIKEKCSYDWGVVVPTLEEHSTIQHSKVFSRDYKIAVDIKLPMPHRNACLEIPLEIGHKFSDIASEEASNEDIAEEAEAPPSYWSVMEEDKASKS